MKKFIFIVFALAGFTFGQSLQNGGVDRYEDEFTGDVMCSQIISQGEVSIGLATYNNDPNSLAWFVFISGLDETPYSLFLSPSSTEGFFVKFDDEVLEMDYFTVDFEFTPRGMTQTVSLLMDPDYMRYILVEDEEVRVRLDGDNYNYDFTFSEQMRILFRTEFFMQCVPAGVSG